MNPYRDSKPTASQAKRAENFAKMWPFTHKMTIRQVRSTLLKRGEVLAATSATANPHYVSASRARRRLEHLMGIDHLKKGPIWTGPQPTNKAPMAHMQEKSADYRGGGVSSPGLSPASPTAKIDRGYFITKEDWERWNEADSLLRQFCSSLDEAKEKIAARMLEKLIQRVSAPVFKAHSHPVTRFVATNGVVSFEQGERL